MVAVAWPLGFPSRFADPGGAQTRCARTMCALSPVPAALLGHTTRPKEAAETMCPFLMAGQFATLTPGPPINESIRLWAWAAGVGQGEQRGV